MKYLGRFSSIVRAKTRQLRMCHYLLGTQGLSCNGSFSYNIYCLQQGQINTPITSMLLVSLWHTLPCQLSALVSKRTLDVLAFISDDDNNNDDDNSENSDHVWTLREAVFISDIVGKSQSMGGTNDINDGYVRFKGPTNVSHDSFST